jgi:hypothetical protein
MPQIPSFLIALLAPTLVPTQPAAKIEIARGETVTLHVAGEGAATIGDRAAAGPLTDTDAEFMRQVRTVAIDPALKSQPAFPGRTATPPPPVNPGILRISFRYVQPPLAKGANGDMLLGIENGYDGALRYKAVISRGDRSTQTDVCIVMPLKRGYEQWPYPLDRIELSDFRIIPWHEGDSITCE